MKQNTLSSAGATLGSVKSETKAAAARENGKSGGRPASEIAWDVDGIHYVLSPEKLECFGAKRAYWLTGAEMSSRLRKLDELFDRNFGRCDGVISEMGTMGEDPDWYSKAPAAAKRILRRFYNR